MREHLEPLLWSCAPLFVLLVVLNLVGYMYDCMYPGIPVCVPRYCSLNLVLNLVPWWWSLCMHHKLPWASDRARGASRFCWIMLNPEWSDIYSDLSPSSVLFVRVRWWCPNKSTGIRFKKLFLKHFTVRSTARVHTYHRRKRSLSLHSYFLNFVE